MDKESLRRAGRPRSDPKRADTRIRILEAAEVEFAARGFAGANLARISAAAGIRRPSLLHHVPTKDALYAAVVEAIFARLLRGLGGAMARPVNFRGRLDAVVGAFSAFVGKHPEAARLILREFLDGIGPGRGILIKEIVPVIDWVEAFVASAGAKAVRGGLPVRAALLQTAADILLRAAAGTLRKPLWGGGDHSRRLAAMLFLKG